MLSLSYAASKLVAVVIALSTLSPPPYGQHHLLQGLELEIGVFAQCELQIEVHEKLVEVFQIEVVMFEVQKHLVMKKRVWVGVQGVLLNLHSQVLGFAPTWSQKVK
ncbi:hypothetical protein Tco_0804498 [Tanacetum coccineum]|uniref:Secreted protein n=1 Tax=Tanacetum coccineum TaxID=301880 RepID=A0ABQ5A4G6_9ASTR